MSICLVSAIGLFAASFLVTSLADEARSVVGTVTQSAVTSEPCIDYLSSGDLCFELTIDYIYSDEPLAGTSWIYFDRNYHGAYEWQARYASGSSIVVYPSPVKNGTWVLAKQSDIWGIRVFLLAVSVVSIVLVAKWCDDK